MHSRAVEMKMIELCEMCTVEPVIHDHPLIWPLMTGSRKNK